MKRLRMIIIAGALALMLVGCGEKEEPASVSGTGPAETKNLAVNTKDPAPVQTKAPIQTSGNTQAPQSTEASQDETVPSEPEPESQPYSPESESQPHQEEPETPEEPPAPPEESSIPVMSFHAQEKTPIVPEGEKELTHDEMIDAFIDGWNEKKVKDGDGITIDRGILNEEMCRFCDDFAAELGNAQKLYHSKRTSFYLSLCDKFEPLYGDLKMSEGVGVEGYAGYADAHAQGYVQVGHIGAQKKEVVAMGIGCAVAPGRNYLGTYEEGRTYWVVQILYKK